MESVFVITADLLIAQACRLRLEDAGFEVAVADAGGYAALDQAQKLMPSCLVIDALLPGLNGLEVLKWITGVPSIVTIPVVLLAERTLRASVLADCASWGARRVVFKDADPPPDIVAVVRELIESQHRSPAADPA